VGSTQLYATVGLGKARVDQTRVISGDLVNPRWYEELHIYCTHFACNAVFSVKARHQRHAHSGPQGGG
jgi:phospholipase D1/2